MFCQRSISDQFVTRNLYASYELKDFRVRQLCLSNQCQQDHESIRANQSIKRQSFHNGIVASEFLPRVVPAVTTLSILLASAMHQPEASQDIVPVFVLRCQPLEPAGLDAADDVAARIATPTLKPFAPPATVFASHVYIRLCSSTPRDFLPCTGTHAPKERAPRLCGVRILRFKRTLQGVRECWLRQRCLSNRAE